MVLRHESYRWMFMRRTITKPFVASLVLMLAFAPLLGCRTIARNAQSQQTIASRRLSRQGLEAAHQGKWAQAESLFANALEMNQVDDRAHWGYAESQWQRGERESAIEHMERALQLSANDPDVQIRLGRMYFEMNRITEAANQANLALRVNRNLAEGWALRGDVLAASDKLNDSLAAYHQALALQPNLPHVQMAVAELYARSGRHDRVLATLDHLQDRVSQDNCPYQAHYLRGIALNELRRPDEARRCFALAARVRPNDVDLLYHWADSQWKTGDLAGARSTIAQALRVEPANNSCQSLAAQLEQAAVERIAADPHQRLETQPR